MNHATLAGHSFEHEVATAAALGILGSIDANRGDEQLGWDTDQFPNNHVALVPAMLEIIRYGGLGTGGMNFDAKVRRESYEPVDLFHAHVGGMDAFARGLKAAHAIIRDGRLDDFIKVRYSSYDSGLGAKIEARKTTFAELEKHALGLKKSPLPGSGRQEMLENLLNDFIR